MLEPYATFIKEMEEDEVVTILTQEKYEQNCYEVGEWYRVNKEEQEAIEYLKAFQKDLYGASEKNLMAIYIDRVWNYIDKLQKENEDMREELQMYVDTDVMKLQEENKELEKTIEQLENTIVELSTAMEE